MPIFLVAIAEHAASASFFFDLGSVTDDGLVPSVHVHVYCFLQEVKTVAAIVTATIRRAFLIVVKFFVVL